MMNRCFADHESGGGVGAPDATKVVKKQQLKNGNDESKEMIDRQFENIGNSSSGKNGRKKGRSRRAPAKTEKTLTAPQSKIAGSGQNSSSASRKKQGRKEDSQTEKEDIQDEDVQEEVPKQKIVETRVLKSNDSSENKRIQYDRQFLLEFQYAQMSRPAYLKNVDCVVYEIHAPIDAFIFQRTCNRHNSIRQSAGGTKSSCGQDSVVSEKTIPGARNKRKKRNTKGGSKTVPVKPQMITHAPQFEKVETKWVRPSILAMGTSDEEKSIFEIQRAVCSILNKLTPQKFELLINQLMALEIDNSDKLETVVNLIFERAIYEREFSVIYANMCRVLANQFMHVPLSGRHVSPSSRKTNPTISFGEWLSGRCITELKKVVRDEIQCAADRNKTFGTEEERKNHLAELDYREMQNRRRMLGCIRFIGELYKLKMLSNRAMHVCIRKLLEAGEQKLLEDPLICLAKLLTNIGNNFEKPNYKRRMDQYFKKIGKIIERRQISSRIRFVLKDVIELRGNAWAPNLDEEESSGGRNKRKKHNRKGGSKTVPLEPQKVIHAPQFEKVETEWVRPSTLAMGMTEEEKSLFEIHRAVCSILNKLTPQKVKPLVDQMMALKIDNSEKLDIAVNLIFERAISIEKLLKVGKQDSLEVQLECLAKLLTTFGEELDKPKHKTRMDEYFKQIGKIIEKTQISSRIRFVLKDVIELRGNAWSPNLDEEKSSGARNKRKKHNRKGGSKTVPLEPQKVIHAPQFEKVETEWVRPSTLAMGMTDEEKSLFEIHRAVCSILNKLTPQKFEPLVDQMMVLQIDNSEKLEIVVNSVFEKAISEPGFSVAYANMCSQIVLKNRFSRVPLSSDNVSLSGSNVLLSGSKTMQTVSFQKLLLDRCKTEFEKLAIDKEQFDVDSKTFKTEKERKNHHIELGHREMQNRRRNLGYIRFFGELYKLKMISDPIMSDCFCKLLKVKEQDSLDGRLECLAKLLTTIGKEFDKPKNKRRMNQYFEQIKRVIEKRKGLSYIITSTLRKGISYGITSTLQDIFELRSNGWVPINNDSYHRKVINRIRKEARKWEKDDLDWPECAKSFFVIATRPVPHTWKSEYRFQLNV